MPSRLVRFAQSSEHTPPGSISAAAVSTTTTTTSIPTNPPLTMPDCCKCCDAYVETYGVLARVLGILLMAGAVRFSSGVACLPLCPRL